MKRTHGRAALLLLTALSLAACSGGETTQNTTPTVGAGTSAPTGTAAKGPGGAPTVNKITFSPSPTHLAPNATETIRASAETADPDGDGVTVEWRWFLNGAEIAGELSDTLRPGRYKKGDRIEAEATPRDTKGTKGTPAKAQVMVRNATPSISSRPTGSLNGYKAVVADPDLGNPLERFTWSLEPPVPPGFALSADGTLSFDAAVGKGAAGQKVTIMVTDSAGAYAKQTFDVTF